MVESAEFPLDFVFAMNDDRIERIGAENDLAMEIIESPRDDLELPALSAPFLKNAHYYRRNYNFNNYRQEK